jgi:EmrB/QacA subfamily drug resistance transporter
MSTALARPARRLDAARLATPLASRRGIWILLLLCLVQFMDILDASILNIALPSMKRDLGFSQESLQWVIDGYVLTYGGFLLLGARAADLLGRRRVMVTGLLIFAGASLAGGLAQGPGLLVGARFVQGMGAAMLTPAALSTLTTTFRTERDRNIALGVWGAVSALAGAAGVLFGGLLTEGPGWRWVLFVNVPLAGVVLAGAFALLRPERAVAGLRNFDLSGALLATGGVLLLVYALVKAPDVGWSAARTAAELAGAGVLLAAFVVNELRSANPLVPLSILRVKGVALADATQMVAVAGFFPMFFFLTLYMQDVLGWSPVETGLAYLPLTGAVIVASGVVSQLFARIGTAPVIVAGALIAAAGLFWLSRIPVDGSYATDLLPGLLVAGFGIGGLFVGATTAANAGVGEEVAGLAAGLLNTGQQVGTALGLAILSAAATARTDSLRGGGAGIA